MMTVQEQLAAEKTIESLRVAESRGASVGVKIAILNEYRISVINQAYEDAAQVVQQYKGIMWHGGLAEAIREKKL